MVGGYYMPIPFEIETGWKEKDVTELFGGMSEFNRLFTTIMEVQVQKPILLNMRFESGRFAQWAAVTVGSSSITYDLLGGLKVNFEFTANNVTCTVS